jgi:purine-nucleoside phosphorylase
MYGFTGTYKGKKVSVQGTGMGVPSMSIYANELVQWYGTKNLIRVGTAGGITPDVKVRDVVIVMSDSHDMAENRARFNGLDYAPTASFDLLYKAYTAAKEQGIDANVGQIFTTDQFYQDDFPHF